MIVCTMSTQHLPLNHFLGQRWTGTSGKVVVDATCTDDHSRGSTGRASGAHRVSRNSPVGSTIALVRFVPVRYPLPLFDEMKPGAMVGVEWPVHVEVTVLRVLRGGWTSRPPRRAYVGETPSGTRQRMVGSTVAWKGQQGFLGILCLRRCVVWVGMKEGDFLVRRIESTRMDRAHDDGGGNAVA